MKPQRILICRPNQDATTETFIKNHAEHLAGNITLASGTLGYVKNKPALTPHRRSALTHIKLIPYWANSSVDYVTKAATYCHINIIKKYQIQAALIEYGVHATYVMQACIKTKTPFLVHFHGYDAHQNATIEKYKPKYKILFELCSGIIVVSEPMRTALIDIGAKPEKIHNISYGVNTDLFKCSQPERSPPICLATGRFVEKKAPHLTILSFEKVLKSHPDAKLVMIGQGPLLSPCKDLVKYLGIANSVSFLGEQSNNSVASHMQQARIFVQHSIRASDGDSEGSPVSIIEASASGLPIVSTFHAGIPNSVIDKETGYLVNEKDIDGMASAIINLLSNPEKSAQMGRAGRSHIMKNYDLPDQIQKINDLLKGFL